MLKPREEAQRSVLNIDEFDYSIFDNYKPQKLGRGNFRGIKKKYLSCICAFDIETTRLKDIEQSFMYIWQFQIEDITVIGRYWQEWFTFLQRIKKRIRHHWLVIYVHNLSYEFSYLKGWYDFQKDEVFCTDARKVLKCNMFDCFEYRCSYFLTNMSLGQFTAKMGVENKKLSGLEFDYEKIRYPWTELSESELQYCINDVKGLVQALKKSFAADNDNVATVPLTSTGYVRRDAKKAMSRYNHKQLQAMLPDLELYLLLREAFRGGNTHANRWIAGQIIENVGSMDIVSAYPNVMMNCPMPMTAFMPIYDNSIDNLIDLMKNKGRALIFRIAFYDIELSDIYDGCPYLSRDKCRNIKNGVYDNGRILSADYLETTLTDLDMKIIIDHYDWSACNPFELYAARYRPLPIALRRVIQQYYKLKTELKGDDENTVYYQKNKEKLNSCYGMTAQDPVKDTIDFINNEFVPRLDDIETLLKVSNRKAFLSYAWGVWVTAWARYRLQQGIDLAGHNFVYCDTDSVKYIGEIDLSEYNKQREYDSQVNGAYAVDNKGVVHYMGVFENENYEFPNRFCTLGAKKYVLEDKNKKLHITIAGVNKILGAEELKKIENFKEGFVFRKAGGTESVFNDNVDQTLIIDGHELEIRDNVVIRPSTYTLGITAEYEAILKGLITIKYSDHDIPGLYYKNY